MRRVCTGIWVMAFLAAGEARADLFDGGGAWWSSFRGARWPLAGRDLNGVALNGEALDGRAVDFVSLEGGTWRGEPLRELRLEASRLRGRAGRRSLSGQALAGAELQARLTDGDALAVRIDDVVPGRGRSDRDVTRYEVSYRTVEGWRPLCGADDEGRPVLAVALNGRWDDRVGSPTGGAHFDDDRSFTFACAGFVLAHCVDGGYAPWRSGRVCRRGQGCQVVTLAAHHQACTRMMRADYCGDGTAHTVDGTPVNAYDGYGLRVDSEDWLFEAEWDADGARCLVEERLAGRVPTCAEALVDPECGRTERFGAGALIFSEVEP